jgi:hypothetical protein
MARSAAQVVEYVAAQETPEERFRRLATSRVEHILDHLRILGNLASPNYRFTDEQIARIFEVIDETVHERKIRFRPRKKREVSFSL